MEMNGRVQKQAVSSKKYAGFMCQCIKEIGIKGLHQVGYTSRPFT